MKKAYYRLYKHWATVNVDILSFLFEQPFLEILEPQNLYLTNNIPLPNTNPLEMWIRIGESWQALICCPV